MTEPSASSIELTEQQRERFERIKSECTDVGMLPEPTDQSMMKSLMDTWDAVGDSHYADTEAGEPSVAKIEALAPICQIAREADPETMASLESVLVEAHDEDVVEAAWSRAEENARPEP